MYYFVQAISAYYTSLKANTVEAKEEAKKKLVASLNTVESFLKDGDKPYFCGDQPGMTDYMVRPHLERMTILLPKVIEGFPVLKKHAERMEKNEAVIACRHSDDLHKQFVDGYASGNTKYDIGTVTD